MTGIIKKLVREKFFGFISANKQVYFFHASGLKNIKFEQLTEGMEVQFEDVDSAKGLRAEDIYA